MNKTLRNCAFAFAFLVACSSAALADGNAFTPLNFDDTAYGMPVKTSQAKTMQPAQAVSQNSGEVAVGNVKMQSAILELDNAQVDVRNELINYKAKYSDVDAQYTAVKSERKALSKQVKCTERRIKKIETAKEKIRKNMI